MKILVLQESDWVERGPHQNHHLMERLAARGHEIRVVDFEIGWPSKTGQSRISPRRVFPGVHKVLETGNVTVIRPAFLRLPVLDYASSIVTHALEIRRQLREFRPDVIVGFGVLNAFLGIRAARKHGIPFVYYIIDELHKLLPQKALRGFSKVIEQANFRRARLVLSINEALREYTVAMGAPHERAKLLRAGIDLDRYLAADGSEVRRRYGLSKDDLLLFFMGWLYTFSGLKEVAEAVVTAPAASTNVKLLIIGKGELWDTLNRIASTDGSAHRLSVESWRPYAELPSYLAAADVCLLPAQKTDVMQNIVPIKMYEYLAAGKPVIATRLPGLVREFGEDHGVVYVDGPHEVVPAALRIADAGLRAHLGSQGRGFVANNDWRRVTDEFESILTGLIAGVSQK